MQNRFKQLMFFCNSVALFLLLVFLIMFVIEKYQRAKEQQKINNTENTASVLREKAEMAHLRNEELKYNLLLRQYDYFEYKEDMGEDE